MRKQNIHITPLDNGMTLLVEEMPAVQSAAFSFLVPAGSIYEPLGQNGTTAILSDLIARGAGNYDSRELLDVLDTLGVQGSESPNHTFLTLSGATLAANMHNVLEVYSDILLRPHLPEDEFDFARAGVTQSLRAIEDEPQQKLMPELKRRTYDVPWGLPPDGTLADLPLITGDSVREHYKTCVRPNGTILAIAGRVDAAEIQAQVEKCFGAWERRPDPSFDASPSGPAHDHIMHQSEQTHIGLAYKGTTFSDPDYYAAWAATCVLGQGMSSRLFSEVREKHGLCYSISASLSGFKHDGRVILYAGTSNDRAQETVDLTLQEIQRLGQGITEEELHRCQATAKSTLIMQQESTRGRARTMAAHWHHLGDVLTLEEVRGKIDALSVDSIQKFLNDHPPQNFTSLTIGPEPLEISDAI